MSAIDLRLGDCVEEMRKLPDGSVDLVVTSPPYNLRNTTGGGMGYIGGIMDHPLNEGYQDHDDNMPHAEYVAWQRECLTEMMRLIPDTGAIFYNHKWRVQGGGCYRTDPILLAGFRSDKSLSGIAREAICSMTLSFSLYTK